MKRTFNRQPILAAALFTIFLFFSGYIGCTPPPPSQNTLYQIDPNHSYVQWHANHLGYSSPSGKWYVQGTLSLDEQRPQQSVVDVSIQMNTLDTGLKELDKHLKSKLFLDVEQYPTATFVSKKIVLVGKDRAKVEGLLTLHGVPKLVTLNTKLNKKGISPITEKDTVGFTATASIKRSDFGITYFLPGVGDEVKLNIELEAGGESKGKDKGEVKGEVKEEVKGLGNQKTNSQKVNSKKTNSQKANSQKANP